MTYALPRSHAAAAAHLPALLRHMLTAWILSAGAEYLLLPDECRSLAGLEALAGMHPIRAALIGGALFAGLALVSRWLPPKVERLVLADAFGLYAASAACSGDSWAFLGACLLGLGVLAVYVRWGWNDSPLPQAVDSKAGILFPAFTGLSAAAFLLLAGGWAVARYRSFSTPTYDFGIFSQLFANLRATGLPVTTLERDGALSHFAVHFSPTLYLLLPLYCLYPRPETVQLLQAAVLASAVVPLWLLARRHGLSSGQSWAVCALLLLYPAYAGGTSYDFHENCLLAPLLLLLLLGLDGRRIPLALLAGVLTLGVKEDAAVYVAIIGLYVLVRGLLRGDRWDTLAGAALGAGAVAYFLGVTAYLSAKGQGVMRWRYENFLYEDSQSLITVVKAVLLCPLKAAWECVEPEKLRYICLTLLPLLALPLLTRRYERYILLIPYLLVNLMSDYSYQHDILFQYSFGSAACLIYLVVVNLADMPNFRSWAALSLALCISLGCFREEILPLAEKYSGYCEEYAEFYDAQRDLLDVVPQDASAAATTYYTAYLSDRRELYDIRYGDPSHILSCEYVALKVNDSGSFQSYATDTADGYTAFTALLAANGYRQIAQLPGVTEIYQRCS